MPHSALNRLIHLLASAVMASTLCAEPPALLSNPSFEDGTGNGPTGWELTGEGEWTTGRTAHGTRAVTVTGDGEGQWRSNSLDLQPGGTYELRFRCRYRPNVLFAPAYAVAGPEFAIQVIPLAADEATPQWKQHVVRFVVPTPLPPAASRIGLGQWRLKGAIDYDDLELYPVKLAHRVHGATTLGEGESITGGAYRFAAPLATWRTVSRPLDSYTDRFHDNRWRFSKADATLVYRHHIAGHRQTKVSIQPEVWFHQETSWVLHVEVSADGIGYRSLGTFHYDGDKPTLSIPPDMLPAETIWVRLRNDASDGSTPVFYQLRGYEYSARLDGQPVEFSGVTTFVTVLGSDRSLSVAPRAPIPGEAVFGLDIANNGTTAVSLSPSVVVTHESGNSRRLHGQKRTLAPAASARVDIPYSTPQPGTYSLTCSLGPALKTALATETRVPILEANHYGKRLPSSNDGVALWWASSGWKVSRTRRPPEEEASAIHISVARNEAECAQLVVRPDVEIHSLKAIAGAFRTASGDLLPASAVDLLRVRYVNVDYVSDAFGAIGSWPDPLPPLGTGCRVPANQNQPLWLRVTPPREATPGVYRGTITVNADGASTDVSVEVNVYDFALPDQTSCRSLFGFSWNNVNQYHRLTTDEQRRTVLDKYLRSFSTHRLSPYDPAPLDHVTYTWNTNLDWEGGRLDEGQAHSGRKSLLAEDTSETSNSYAHLRSLLPISGKPLRLGLWYRTLGSNESAAIYICHFDSARQWYSGKNRHIDLRADTNWRELTRTIEEFPEGTAFVRLMAHGCRYSDPGERTGSVWVDDVSLIDTDTGAELVVDGGFEDAKVIGPELGVTFDWKRWDGALDKAVNDYHFNSFVFRVPGLGGGTFYARRPGELLGHAQGTPTHRALFQTWCGEARAHLEARGLLKRAVCYPFDEPAEKDYDFVVEQLLFLKDGFPGLSRMIPMNLGAADAFLGWVDYWCPVLSSHNRDFARERREAGDRYTWYICCSPKAPYIANFIDRAGTDLRVWLWQTWQENVDGVLIWQTNYWHSRPAYPDALQNPYEDSMSWVGGYGTKPGEKRRWNVGDGRFIYPPEAATGSQIEPILDGPVSSIRWEALRDGMEDFEYLSMLKRLLARKRQSLSSEEARQCQALLTVPAEISESLTSYTRDPGPIEARRRELAQAIEALVCRP
ncbi:MAG: DUF4091 domain-containing protein [Lentisphaerae bacterium]|jgi:hypothetical protein|nr:DUF4091 domain-containing protein [Lentisphaerota bacterium]MBT5612300.1 DUF4091 domain-containing protein [Lentisphaerota bacterium]MBT7060722.1 DUF4091 domain-containing protein [Lentisphaerota bacterium]MBT7845279.1 DUF4091 domain-containing protein [Lentisphaerota bacterium]